MRNSSAQRWSSWLWRGLNTAEVSGSTPDLCMHSFTSCYFWTTNTPSISLVPKSLIWQLSSKINIMPKLFLTTLRHLRKKKKRWCSFNFVMHWNWNWRNVLIHGEQWSSCFGLVYSLSWPCWKVMKISICIIFYFELLYLARCFAVTGHIPTSRYY